MFTPLFPSASDTDSERIPWPLLTKDRESTRSFLPCLATKSNRWPFTTSKQNNLLINTQLRGVNLPEKQQDEVSEFFARGSTSDRKPTE